MTTAHAFRIVRIEAFACRHPLTKPVVTSFGTLRDRPAVFVRIEDEQGVFGGGRHSPTGRWPARSIG